MDQNIVFRFKIYINTLVVLLLFICASCLLTVELYFCFIHFSLVIFMKQQINLNLRICIGLDIIKQGRFIGKIH